jgi:hypothetical protein
MQYYAESPTPLMSSRLCSRLSEISVSCRILRCRHRSRKIIFDEILKPAKRFVQIDKQESDLFLQLCDTILYTRARALRGIQRGTGEGIPGASQLSCCHQLVTEKFCGPYLDSGLQDQNSLLAEVQKQFDDF